MLLRQRCETDPVAQAHVLERCRRDPIWFIDNWIWSTNPHRIEDGLDPLVPLCLWPRQEDVVNALLSWRRIVIDKPRMVGISYVVLALFLHHWLFVPSSKFGLGSTKLSKIFDETEDSLFGKVMFMFRRLPAWMKPPESEWKFGERKGTYVFVNKTIDTAIVGAAATEDIFHGARHTCDFFDEAARIRHLGRAMKGVLGSSRGVCVASTPNGPTGYFPDLVQGNGVTTIEVKPGATTADVLRLDRDAWIHIALDIGDDPRKDEDWERRERAQMTPAQFEEQYLRRYDAKYVPGQIFSQFRRELHLYGAEDWEQAVEAGLLEGAVYYEVWDPGHRAGVVWLAYLPRYNEVVALDYRLWHQIYWEDIVAEVARAGWRCSPNEDLFDDPWDQREIIQAGREGILPHHRVCDPAGNRTDERTHRSWIGDFKTRGIHLRPTHNRDVDRYNRVVQQVLRFEALSFAPACARKLAEDQAGGDVPTLVESMENYRLGVRGESIGEHVGTFAPIKDEYAELADCMRYGIFEIFHRDRVAKLRWSEALKRWTNQPDDGTRGHTWLRS